MSRKILLDQAEANRFINRQWLDVLRPIPFAVLDENRGAFFGSIFGTWNHLLLGDRLWLGRIAGKPFPFESMSERLYEDLSSFELERSRTDDEWVELVEGWKDPESPVSYRNTKGNPFTQPFSEIMTHVFAHQYHHRGHISQMCHELKIDIPDGGALEFYRHRMAKTG
jgi:uncharacterized damage-inducible protein DinB